MQHLKREDFAGEINFDFCTWCIKALSLSFKITPHFSKLIEAIKFYNCKSIKKILIAF